VLLIEQKKIGVVLCCTSSITKYWLYFASTFLFHVIESVVSRLVTFLSVLCAKNIFQRDNRRNELCVCVLMIEIVGKAKSKKKN